MNQYDILNFKTNNGYIQIKGRYQYDSHDAAGPAAVSDASLSCKQKVSIFCLPIITWYDYQTEQEYVSNSPKIRVHEIIMTVDY